MADAALPNRMGQVKRLNAFERYLSVWVAGCMVAGVLLGKLSPGLVESLRGLEFAAGSQINVPIAVLIWLMIIPMMMKVDFTAILRVGQRPKGVLITLFVNLDGEAVLDGPGRLGLLPACLLRVD